jgi:hypothetical protein
MYEKPELTRVGDASETILGIVVDGEDLDGSYIWKPNQFQIETIEDE